MTSYAGSADRRVEVGVFDLVDDCRICGSADLRPVLDLGPQPLANSLRRESAEVLEEIPLDLVFCGSCQTPQLTATVDPAELFRHYIWVTGTARTTRAYSTEFRDRIIGIAEAAGADLPTIVEVASNDGTFLRRFQEAGWQVLGVDPAENIASKAQTDGIPTRCDFFDRTIADDIRAESGPADVVVARNVIPHVRAIHSILDGISALVAEDGVAVIEFHSADRIVKELHYDSIYHEHLFYFSLITLSSLCTRYGLHAFDVFDSPISGGSRVLLLSRSKREKTAALRRGLEAEEAMGLGMYEIWQRFGEESLRHARSLADVVSDRAKRSPVIGYGASARSSTMLNFAGIGNTEVTAVIDQNPGKQGLFTPGTDIPIVSRSDGLPLLGDDGAVLLMAWNFADEIVGDLRSDGVHCDVIVPLPGQVRTV